MQPENGAARRCRQFQCSSASRKIGNRSVPLVPTEPLSRFSALLRAEKSEIHSARYLLFKDSRVSVLFCEPKNRKSPPPPPPPPPTTSFSALLRAEKSEIDNMDWCTCPCCCVSVLFCEPKNRKFQFRKPLLQALLVSVLFCEPKNRKSYCCWLHRKEIISFSALLRAEKSEIRAYVTLSDAEHEFQCSSASRKIGNYNPDSFVTIPIGRFSALLRAEKSEIRTRRRLRRAPDLFQCSSASRKIGNLY